MKVVGLGSLPLVLVAITRPTGPELARCELTHIDRVPIDIDRAMEQHAAYVATLVDLGVSVHELDRLPGHPDAVFVEDTALVLDALAVMLRPGAVSRRGELSSVAEALARYREVVWLEGPGSVDGGDVIVLGRTLLVGRTSRSDVAGITALEAAVAPFDYVVREVTVTDCLHLKTAATAVDHETIIAHRPFADLDGVDARIIEVPPDEPQGANVVSVGATLLADATAQLTLRILEKAGFDIRPVDVSEFAKAEGALTCKSLILTASSREGSGSTLRSPAPQ